MSRLPEPLCEFCRHKDGTVDYDELHAIICGLGFPLWLWPFIIWKDSGCAHAVFTSDPWYVGFGMLLRLIAIGACL